MGDATEFPIVLDSDLGRELIVDCARFREGLLDEKAIRKKYRFDEAAWEALGNDEMVRAVEEESVRRVRDGSVRKEKSQKLMVSAPDVLGAIMNSGSDVSPRHKIDSAKVLNDFASNGPAGTPGADATRFLIQINLGSEFPGVQQIDSSPRAGRDRSRRQRPRRQRRCDCSNRSKANGERRWATCLNG